MRASAKRANKHYRLTPKKIKYAQKILRAKTETETLERALDNLIEEYEKNQKLLDALERFEKSGAVIEDVFGKL